jgi:hypothetical protein
LLKLLGIPLFAVIFGLLIVACFNRLVPIRIGKVLWQRKSRDQGLAMPGLRMARQSTTSSSAAG